MRFCRMGGMVVALRRVVATAGLALVAFGPWARPVCFAQAAPRDQATTTPAAVADLSTRYRFSERYTARDEKVEFGAIGQYQVAFKQTVTSIAETPRGTPTRKEATQQAIYTER